MCLFRLNCRIFEEVAWELWDHFTILTVKSHELFVEVYIELVLNLKIELRLSKRDKEVLTFFTYFTNFFAGIQ